MKFLGVLISRGEGNVLYASVVTEAITMAAFAVGTPVEDAIAEATTRAMETIRKHEETEKQVRCN